MDSIASILKELEDLYRRKNTDYGDSAYKTFEEFGITAYLIRLSDKLNRLKTLAKSDTERSVSDESIRDTLIDLSLYAILAIVDLDKERVRADLPGFFNLRHLSNGDVLIHGPADVVNCEISSYGSDGYCEVIYEIRSLLDKRDRRSLEENS